MKSTGRQVLFLCFTTGAFVTLIFQPFPIRTATNDDFGQLVVKHEHLDWPSPESVVRGLRSPDEEVRLKAPDEMRDDMARYELVFRASGEGTGIYRQDEAHFRVYKGELKAVVAVLAESRGKTAVPPDVYFRIREPQDRLLNGLSCRAFRWNRKLFQYEPVSVPNVCGSPGK